MGRLQPELLERVERFADRVLDVVDALADQNRPRRILDQMTGSGTSVGANTYEADEAMSRADFWRCLGVAPKELNETRYWLRLVVRRKWLPVDRLTGLEIESLELKRVIGSIIAKSRSPIPASS